MINNQVNITSNELSVCIALKVKSNKTGIFLLIVCIILFIVILLTGIFYFGNEESKSSVLPIVIVLIVISFFPLKYLLWNLYGEEELIITTKSISHSYDYGFFKTNLKTISYYRLATGYEEVKKLPSGTSIGRLIFYDYSEETNLPSFIHQTSVLIPEEKIKEIDGHIDRLFVDERFEGFRFIPYSEN